MQPETNKTNLEVDQPNHEAGVSEPAVATESKPEPTENLKKPSFYQDLNSILLTTILSLFVYTIVALGLSWVVSWGLAQANLYPWVFNQSPILLWAIFGLVSVVLIGAIMVQAETIVEKQILPKLQKFSEQGVLVASLLVLVGLILGMYFVVSNFINYLNVTFWLK